jgi:hypothetical protein
MKRVLTVLISVFASFGIAQADIIWTGSPVNLKVPTNNGVCDVVIQSISRLTRGQPLVVDLVSSAPMGLVMTVRLGLQLKGPKGTVFASEISRDIWPDKIKVSWTTPKSLPDTYEPADGSQIVLAPLECHMNDKY